MMLNKEYLSNMVRKLAINIFETLKNIFKKFIILSTVEYYLTVYLVLFENQ